jgi:hypothetical protein
VAIFAVPFGPKGVAKEVEVLLASTPHTRLGLVEAQSDSRHHPARPLQRVLRSTSTEDDEVVGVVDQPGGKLSVLASLDEDPQEPVHVDVRE